MPKTFLGSCGVDGIVVFTNVPIPRTYECDWLGGGWGGCWNRESFKDLGMKVSWFTQVGFISCSKMSILITGGRTENVFTEGLCLSPFYTQIMG